MRKMHVLLAVGACSLLSATPAFAQDQATAEDEGEIIVTARKRAESILKVPVVETVITQEKLENSQINDLVRLTTRVPGVLIGQGALAIGPQISIRGVGTSTQDAGVDQSVSLNLDGLSMGQGLAYRSALFDVAQIEVLKGPQALFYGKSSTGGVVSIRTADPGDRLEVIARAGHEFEADEKRGELIISAPLTETFGIRLAAMVSDALGFFRNEAVALPATGAAGPKFRRYDDNTTFFMRGTAVWRPSAAFDARLKVNYTNENVQGNSSHNQLASCPDGTGPVPGTGIQFLSPLDDCKMDRESFWVDMDPTAFPGIRNNGVPFIKNIQKFSTLELNFRPTQDLTLTSVTAYYRLKSDVFINSTQTGASAPYFVTDNSFRRRDLTQEFRLDSSFSGPINFTLGTFYQDAQLGMIVRRFINQLITPNPFRTTTAGTNGGRTTGQHDVDIKTYAAFAQLRWKPAEEFEIAAGARYTDEKRTEEHFNLTPGAASVVVPLAVGEIRAKNWSPELTITYTPTDDLTFFGSLKQGYKSGSFTLTQLFAPGFNNSFGDEKVQGGEVGMKARLLDRSLFVNAAAYLYKYKGLQVGTTETNPATGLPLARTLNAGGAKVYGAEFDVTYRPPSIEGLTLTGAINYTHGRFTDLHGVPCWGGQRIEDGCNEFLNTSTGRFTAQGLDGLRLVRAPDWQIMAGADYETPIGNGMTLIVGADGLYTSKFPTALSRREDTVMKGYFIFNANVALRGPDDEWEVALIGNNIGNKITWSSCSQANFANGVGAGIITGATTRGVAGIDEVMCTARRGREVWIRVTLKPAALLGGLAGD